MTADALTKPERNCARGQARTVRELVTEEGGCCYCTRRAHLFEGIGRRALCGINPPKRFPGCVGQPQGFQFDEAAFLEGAGRNLHPQE